MTNLLTSPLIQTDAGWFSLPSLLAAMAQGKVQSFPAMRPHQRPAWHMFLVQLAVLALNGAGLKDIPEDAEAWAAALRGLTPDFQDDCPWFLIGEDRSKPAFLQPAETGGGNWSRVRTPDALDMVITARNHDLKAEVAAVSAPQDWVFALVSLQTMEGFGGRGNYGIARMNGGSSSRAMISLAPVVPGSSQIDPSKWWRRDVKCLLTVRDSLSGIALIWLHPWPDNQSLSWERLDDLCVEVCRRVRLVEDGGIVALKCPSTAPRIDAKALKGNTGDPWAPIEVTEGKSFTLGDRDWTARDLNTLMFEGAAWKRPRLAEPFDGEDTSAMAIVAEAFSRGNSKTDGFKSRVVPVPKAVVKVAFGSSVREVCDGILADIASIEGALKFGLRLYSSEGDKAKLDSTMKSASARGRLDSSFGNYLASYRDAADQAFFPEMWVRLAAKPHPALEIARRKFVDLLTTYAKAEFELALDSLPCATLMRPRARVRAEAAFYGSLHKIKEGWAKEETSHDA